MSDQFSLPEIAESPLIWYYSWLPKLIFFFIQVHRARRNGGPGLSTYWQGRFRPRLSYTGIFFRRSDVYLKISCAFQRTVFDKIILIRSFLLLGSGRMDCPKLTWTIWQTWSLRIKRIPRTSNPRYALLLSCCLKLQETKPSMQKYKLWPNTT